MIPYGGPTLCGACRTLAHEPRLDCPEPFVCTYLPGECADPRCREIPPL